MYKFDIKVILMLKNNKLTEISYYIFYYSLNLELSLIIIFDTLPKIIILFSKKDMKLLNLLLNKLKNFFSTASTSVYFLYLYKKNEFIKLKNYFCDLNKTIENNKIYESEVKNILKELVNFYLNIFNSF